MPPEPLPWDRKDFFKERKHERSSSDSLSGPSVSRWKDRDTPHHHGGSYRWGSQDFRRPSGHGKQGGGWHMFPEELGPRGDGKYSRNGRENRMNFNSQKDWKGHSWETTASPNGNSHTHSDIVNSWEQVHHFKDQHDKNGGVSNTGQRCERENSLGSIDWKPLKWVRSGSLSSRGSGFSHSSSSKSLGVDSVEIKIEPQPSNAVTPLQSPSGDITACATSTAPAEENNSRKKPRLKWGEGLAKYEKKKVEGPDEIAAKDTGSKIRMVDDVSNLESLHSNLANLADKSPSLTGYSECASPATPSSVACSSSPGLEEKSFGKAVTVDNDISNPSASSGGLSQYQSDEFTFNLENLELTQIVNLSSSLSDLLQPDDPSTVDSGFVRSTAMDKLLVWKANISKTLEVTESEIDSLENELKSLASDSGSACPCPAASSSLPVVSNEMLCDEKCLASSLISRPSPLQVISSGDMFLEKDSAPVEEHAEVKDEEIDSPGTATSKFIEPLSLQKDVIPFDAGKQSDCSISLVTGSENCEANDSVNGAVGEISCVSPGCGDGAQLAASNSFAILSTDVGLHCVREDNLSDLIMASNRDLANRATEVFNNLLPTNHHCVDISTAINGAHWQSNSMIERFAMRKRFLRFKERVLTLKFRAFKYLWKEDLRLLSMRRFPTKSHKKFELSSRFVLNGYQKHRSSIRSRFSSPAGNLSLVPTAEIINYTNKLLSDSQVMTYGTALKMPALILDKKEKRTSKFISNNGLVEDPCAVEQERSVINPWSSQEKEIFLDKFAIFGKDFKKIASFLDHKTIADCVQFYYKNHKSDSFLKTKKKPEFAKQGKAYSANTYLVTSGKRWNRDTNAASLDMLGAASAIAANVDDVMENQRKCTSRFYVGTSSEYKWPRGDDGILERSSSLVAFGNERETAAADVLAGICGSISSEALSSCITSSVDPVDGYHQEWKSQKAGGFSKRRPLTPEVTQRIFDDETCSDDSCEGEMDPADWTDEEKSIFMQAVALYGKDFAMISRCIRTRSRDQCKVFFSKARKCLGLDMMHPENGSEGATDANGGGSDTEDACMVDTGSVISSSHLTWGCKMEEEALHLSSPKLEQSESARGMNLHSEMKQVKDNNGTDDKAKLDVVGDSITGNSILEEAVPEVVEAIEGANFEEARQGEDNEHIISEPVSAKEANDCGLPLISGAEVETKAVDEVSMKCSRDEPEGCEVRSDSNISDMNGLNSCPTGDPNSTPCSAIDRKSSLKLGAEGGNAMKLDTAQKSSVISLEQENSCLTSNSFPQESIAIHQRKTVSHDTSSKLYFRKSCDRLAQKSASTDGYPLHLPKHSLLDCVESSPILRGYPVSVSNKKGVNVDLSCNESLAAPQSTSKIDRNLILDRFLPQDSFLQRCNNVKPNGLASDLSFMSQEQKQSSLSDVEEKPSRSGDVKLFGQILTTLSSQQQKPNCSAHENEDKGAAPQHLKLNGGKAFDLKFNGNHSVDKTVAQQKLDRNNIFGVETNIPMRSYGFRDGNRIQTGFPSLPDSAILLAKYPSAFTNKPTSSSKLEQQPLHSIVRGSERSINGVSGFTTRELSSSSRVADYQMYRSRDGTKVVQPFTVDKLRQDFLFSEMQRRKESEAISSIQQGRGIVGINVVGSREGGLLVSGACNNISDPVAAIKMHYAKAEQYGGSIVTDGESWRGKGDIGR